MHGPAFLIPVLHTKEGLGLPQAGLVASAPMVGVMLTLVAWGAFADRHGERRALLAGLALTTVAGVGAMTVHGPWGLGSALFVAGAAAAAANSASGRVVVGWFPAHRRGLAMGIRQMAQPLGVGLAALTMAALADRHGLVTALAVPTVAAAVALALVAGVVIDPPREGRQGVPTSAASPYRADRYLVRVHGVSMLLVVPQFVVWTYALTWLVSDRHWSAQAAGAVVAVAQVLGAGGRIAAGQLSDTVGSRMRPLRWVALAAVATMLALGLAAGLRAGVAVALMVIASAVTVADNGLAFTAVAERAGSRWSGRALGVQNTGQFLVAAAVPPAAGLLITTSGYAAAFTAAAVFAAAAVPLIPVAQERRLR
jgi:MFS family permease